MSGDVANRLKPNRVFFKIVRLILTPIRINGQSVPMIHITIPKAGPINLQYIQKLWAHTPSAESRSTQEINVQVDFTPGLLQISFNRRSGHQQPMRSKSTAATGSISTPMGHNGQPVDPVRQHKRVVTMLLGQHQREPAGTTASTASGPPGLGTWDLGLGTWDLGLGTWDLGRWGDGEMGRWGAGDREGC